MRDELDRWWEELPDGFQIILGIPVGLFLTGLSCIALVKIVFFVFS